MPVRKIGDNWYFDVRINGVRNRQLIPNAGENFRFHDLRHTAGTRLAEAGADAFTIKDILGHASIQTSAIYVHATDEGKRRAINALGQYAENSGQKLVKNEKEQAK